MQASEECFNLVDVGKGGLVPHELTNEAAWLKARDNAVEMAWAFSEAGYHKQLVNRLIEPFAHITVLVSSTEWNNFLELRDHPMAEPHIQLLAKEIRKCLEDENMIQDLNPGEWHLPFITEFVESYVYDAVGGNINLLLNAMKKISVARCASTSYKTVDGFDMSLERAIDLHDRLAGAKPGHLSPFEHVACVDQFMSGFGSQESDWDFEYQHANFVGFRQYRHML